MLYAFPIIEATHFIVSESDEYVAKLQDIL